MQIKTKSNTLVQELKNKHACSGASTRPTQKCCSLDLIVSVADVPNPILLISDVHKAVDHHDLWNYLELMALVRVNYFLLTLLDERVASVVENEVLLISLNHKENSSVV